VGAAAVSGCSITVSACTPVSACVHRTLLLPPSGVCVPPAEGNYSLDVWRQVVQLSHEVLGDGYSVPLIDTYKWTVPLHWGHISLPNDGWDCLHYCRPGLSEVGTDGWPVSA
jgi:hypothetical protein